MMPETTYVRGRGFHLWHLFATVSGEHAYAVCGQVFSMRRAAEIVTAAPSRVCGACRAKEADNA